MFERNRLNLLSIASLALIAGFFFFPLWGQRAWLPSGGGDAVSFLYPMYRFIAASFARGEIPLWNPQQYAGAPLIADNQAGMFYPPNLLLFLLKPDFSYVALQWLVGLHIFWAGLGTYVCVRKWRAFRPISPPAALIAAVAFMFSDVFITHIGNLNLIAVASWLPWAFSTFHHGLNNTGRRKAVYLLTTGVIIGVSALAGHAQMTFYIALLLGLYALWQTAVARDWQALPALALVGAIGIGIAALTILPSLEMNPLSRRGAFSYAETVNYSLPWEGLVGIVAPGFFGRGAANFWGAWDRVEFGYMGLLPLMLVAFSIQHSIFSKRTENQKPNTEYRFFALGALLFLLLALGGNTPVHRLVLGWAQLPFQVPARFVLLMNFCLAMLAAFGLDNLLRASQSGENRRLATVGVRFGLGLLLLLWLAQRYVGHEAQIGRSITIYAGFGLAYLVVLVLILRQPSWRMVLGCGLVLLLSAEIFQTSQYVEVEWNNPLAGYQNEVAIEYLQANAGINRIDEATGLWQPSAAQMFGLYSSGGVFNPLELATHAAVAGSVGYRGSPLYSLLGIKYIVADKTDAPGDTAFIVPVYDADPTVDIYLNTNALPRIMMLYENQVVDSHDAAFAALHSGIDFTQTIIVESGAALSTAAANHQIGVAEYSNNRVVVDVSTDAAGYLLLTDMYYPNWDATVDGVDAEILRANYAFRAILLEAGEHRVEMEFSPRSWQIGWKISAATWAVVIAAFVALWRQGWIDTNE